MPNDIHSRVFHMAWVLHKHRPDHPWPKIVGYAWYFHHLRVLMRTNIVQFSYFKTDGSIRQARGTLCLDLIPEKDRPQSASEHSDESPKKRKENYETLTYYDLDREAWRSFKITEFIGIGTTVTPV